MRFKGSVVLVTGSSRGIGRETALQFSEEGGTVIVHGSHESKELAEALEQVTALSPNSIQVACDLSDSVGIRGMFQEIDSHFGRLNVLVNNAATQNAAPFMQLPEEDWDRIVAVNLKAPMLCGQLAANMMVKQGGGKIINIGSVHTIQARRNYAHYTASKGGLLMLTKSMALELAEHNIQVNHVAPGAIATSMTDPERQRLLLPAIPAGRIGQSREVAAAVCFLASNEADYFTGASITLDGGLSLGFSASRPDL